ncbi:MAG TPA: CHAT domain-containing tetratricopeptide repeat protein [Geminicoccaceae bacterium]|nr:CHAT domain-containing tetratricopeptide repeat protein [Geminicoccaceae bacterium]
MLKPTPILLLLLILLGACASLPSPDGRSVGPTVDDSLQQADMLLAADRYEAAALHDEAASLLEDALRRAERLYGNDHPKVAPVLGGLARAYEAQGRHAEAEPLLRRAAAIRRAAYGPDHPDVAASLADLAWFYAGRGRLDEAIAAIREAAEVRRVRVLTERYLTPGGAADIPPPQPNVVSSRYVSIGWRLAQEEPGLRDRLLDETFRAGQLIQASDVAAAVARVAARIAIGEDELARLVRVWLDLVERRRGLDRALVRAASRPQTERDGAVAFLAEGRLRRELAATAARLNAVNDETARRFPSYKEMTGPEPASVEEIQSLLAPDEALLAYAVADPDPELAGDEELFLWAIRRDRAEMARIDLTPDELERAVRRLRAQLDPVQWIGGMPRFDTALAHRLYAQLLPADPSLLAGVDRLLIVPGGALESLPFSILVRSDSGSEADYREVDWFARRYATVTLPSVSALRVLRRLAEPSRAVGPFRGVGNPVLTGMVAPETDRNMSVASLVAEGLADPAKVRALPPLPETADELSQLARILGADDDSLLLAEQATETAVKAGALSRARVIAFATHAGVAGELPGLAEPALVLTPPEVASEEDDGVLTVSEVAELSLDADFVVLSACNTAAPDGTPGAAGLSGLAKAFLHAGTRSLLVSHWAVISDAAVRLTTGMFTELSQNPGLGPAEALRRSQLALLDDPQRPELLGHPAAWAPFVLVGEETAPRPPFALR